MNATTEPLLLSLNDIASLGGIDPKTVRRAIARGELRAYRLGPRIIRIRAEDFEAWCRPLDEADLLRIGR